MLRLQRSIGNRAVSGLLARQPDVAVRADDTRVGGVSPDVGGVHDVDVGWYRRLNQPYAGGVVRIDEGSIYKDPTDVRLDLVGLHPLRTDDLVLRGSVHFDGFDRIRGEFQLRLRYEHPKKLWQRARATTPDALWKRLEPALREAVPGLDTARLVDELKSLFEKLASGAMTPDSLLKALEGAVRRAAKGANVAALEKALWRFLAEFGPELDATGRLYGLSSLGTRAHGELRFTPEGPVASYGASRGILAPPGAVTSTWAPAWGEFEETQTLHSHKRFMYGILQKLDTDALGREGSLLVEKFPTSGYLEYSYARSYGDDLEVGVRIGVRASTSDIAHYVPHKLPDGSPADAVRNVVGGYQNIAHPRVRGDQLAPLAELVPPLPTEIPYNVGITIYGTFGWLGGKGAGER
jgi:hypothetical protein